jgi:prolyl-tRNA editing enzyme YbaK/EbsC (Cys-tRNA(Pro) deacylase)
MGVASLAMVPIAMWGVSPLGWSKKPDITLIDEALNDYPVVWAAAGHPHGVFPTSYLELMSATGATPVKVGD